MLTFYIARWATHAETRTLRRRSAFCSPPGQRNGGEEEAFACAATDRSGRAAGTGATGLKSDVLRVRDTGEFESSGRAEMKTNKHKTLQLIRKQGIAHSRDLVWQFGYSPGTARSYLSHLGRQGLLEQVAGGYELTAKGMIRVRYFDVFGCAGIACPLCKGKTGFLSCPRCGHRISKKDAKISKERDFLLVLRHAGVYCDRCATLIVDEAQAQLLGIAREE